MNKHYLNQNNRLEFEEILDEAIKICLDHTLSNDVKKSKENPRIEDYITAVPQEGLSIEETLAEFKEKILPYCYNFSSKNFMGFPDAGNSIPALTASVMADLLQQNLINQTFCGPSATFAEIEVIRWLREVVGYKNSTKVNDIFDVGGIITAGGTLSNTIGILLARENYQRNCMADGVKISDGHYLVVPKGIGHYSVKSAQMWLGLGNRLLEVDTNNYRYDLGDLRRVLTKHRGEIMGLVAYAGDSRTMTVDHFDEIVKLTKEIDPSIWLHADACHGFSLGFSEKLKHKIKGIEEFDSIATDPHKVLNAPYTVSALLVKRPSELKKVASISDLIMKEQFAFGQTTPFVGSKSWMSLKLWFAIKSMGVSGIAKTINDRHSIALQLHELIRKDDDFIPINDVGINAVALMYVGFKYKSIAELNNVNQIIHKTILNEGKYHLHSFSIPDKGVIQKGEILCPLRFMSGNPNLKRSDLNKMINYVKVVAKEVVNNNNLDLS